MQFYNNTLTSFLLMITIIFICFKLIKVVFSKLFKKPFFIFYAYFLKTVLLEFI